MRRADPASSDLTALGAALDEGSLSSEALTLHCLYGLEGVGRALNAVVALDAEGALGAARQADARRAAGGRLGPLDGIPFAVKDNISTAPPLDTLLGVASLSTPLPRVDAEAVVRLRRAGAVLLGKLSLMELMAMLPFEGFDASATGACRNPYDGDAWTGDSSTGPAAAVAAGLVPFALATETHGSIIQPAGFCGVVGLRPTHGAVPLDGTFLIAPSLDRVGPIARTAGDALLVLRAIGDVTEAPPRSEVPHIGLLAPVASADAEVRANFEVLARRAAQMARLTSVEIPDLPIASCFRTILTEEARPRFAPLIADGTVARLISPGARGGSYLAGPGDPDALARALARRDEIDGAVSRWLAPFDALLAVTNPRVAPPLDTTFDEWFGAEDHEPVTTLGALLGLPAVSIPCGLGAALRPVGVQLVGRRHSDVALLRLAEQLASMLPRITPPERT